MRLFFIFISYLIVTITIGLELFTDGVPDKEYSLLIAIWIYITNTRTIKLDVELR